MAEDIRDPAPAAVYYPEPSDTGAMAAVTVLLHHLLILPATGNVRRLDAEWPGLDPYRIGHPSQCGWPAYLAYGLVMALVAGLLMGGAHRAASRRMGGRKARRLLGWGFLLLAAATGFFAPVFLHRFTRVPDRSPAAPMGPKAGPRAG